jgi:signal transduction histidine kinase
MWSLRTLTTLFLAAFCTAAALTGYATFTAQRRAITYLVDDRINELSASLLTGIRPGDSRALAARIDAFSRRRDSGDIGFELYDAAGRRLAGNVQLRRKLPSGFSQITRDDGISGLPSGRALVRHIDGGLVLTLIGETEPIDGYNAYRTRNYIIGFGSMMLIVALGTALFGLIVRRRIGELRETAEAIIDGDMQRRVPVDRSGGSFADQALTFNRMLDRIAELMAGVRNVSNDIAHDLRTPLARLKSRLTLLAAKSPESGELETAIEQCDELLAMFAATLRIAEVESGARRANFRAVDLADLVRQIHETLEDIAAEGGRALSIGACGPAPVLGDWQLLSQALINLVENALHHTPPGTRVTLETRANATTAELIVRDNGPGIPPEERKRALRRFGRLDISRTTPGHGLGLPLAEAVARLHHGELVLGDAAPGLCAVMTLPRLPDHDYERSI